MVRIWKKRCPLATLSNSERTRSKRFDICKTDTGPLHELIRITAVSRVRHRARSILPLSVPRGTSKRRCFCRSLSQCSPREATSVPKNDVNRQLPQWRDSNEARRAGPLPATRLTLLRDSSSSMAWLQPANRSRARVAKVASEPRVFSDSPCLILTKAISRVRKRG
jgi:hypothetical protein